jgi:hypothetical protein
MIKDQTSETGSIPPGSDHHVEELVTTIVESLASYMNPLFTDPLGQPLIDPPSTRYVNSYYFYYLPPNSTTTQCFGVNPSSFGFFEGLGNIFFFTTPIVYTASDFIYHTHR